MNRYFIVLLFINLNSFAMQDKYNQFLPEVTISKSWIEASASCQELIMELPNGDRYIYTMLRGSHADHGQISKNCGAFEQRYTATQNELNLMRAIYDEYQKRYKKTNVKQIE